VRGATSARSRELKVDGIVAGLGIEPNVELARAAGLAVANGILVDDLLRTSHPDIYAAGDVASFPSPAVGGRFRVEHEDNANAMGHRAGRNAAGRAEPYDYLPFFYSTLFDVSFQGVGRVDSRLETVVDLEAPQSQGAIFYHENRRVRGVLTWNRFGQVEVARQLIAGPGPLRPEDLKGALLEAA
jgi:3-phenylpropionate/trans-cinnamate dioxygenase ferredoxin reductase component